MSTAKRHRLKVLITDPQVASAYGSRGALPAGFEFISPLAAQENVVSHTSIHPKPDFILIEMAVGTEEGCKAIHELSRQFPQARIILYPSRSNLPSLDTEAALYAAMGAPPAGEPARVLGGYPVGPQFRTNMGDQEPNELTDRSGTLDCSEITDRQHDVLALLAAGYAMKQIAYRLGITYRTVTFHKYRMMQRLGIKSNAGLMSYALQRSMNSERAIAA